MFGLISGALGVASGIKGLFSKGPKERTPKDGILSQASGARAASDKYGFNPLTLLQAGAGHGFSQTQGGPPPLASVAAITDGLRGIDDVLSGDQARRRQADQLEIDLAKVKLDEARRGVGILGQTPPFLPSLARSGPLTGNRAATVAQPTARAVTPKFGAAENPIAPGRKKDVAPLTNSPGVFEIENAGTPFGPITLPGEGEPWGIDELATAAVVGIPQIIGGGLSAASQAVKDRFWGGKSALEHFRENSAQEAETPEGKAKKTEWERLQESQSHRNPYRNR